MKVDFTIRGTFELGCQPDYGDNMTPDEAADRELRELFVGHSGGFEVNWSVETVASLGDCWDEERDA